MMPIDPGGLDEESAGNVADSSTLEPPDEESGDLHTSAFESGGGGPETRSSGGPDTGTNAPSSLEDDASADTTADRETTDSRSEPASAFATTGVGQGREFVTASAAGPVGESSPAATESMEAPASTSASESLSASPAFAAPDQGRTVKRSAFEEPGLPIMTVSSAERTRSPVGYRAHTVDVAAPIGSPAPVGRPPVLRPPVTRTRTGRRRFGRSRPLRPLTPRQRATRRWIGRGFITLGILVLASALWVGWKTLEAYQHLDTAAGEVSSLQAQVKDLEAIDVDNANAAITGMQVEAGQAVDAVRDPLFRLAGRLPWIGPNLQAISTVAQTVDGLAKKTAPTLLQIATTVRPASLAPRNGAIDIGPITNASGALQAADAEVVAASARMSAIDRGPLAGAVATAVNSLQDKLSTLHATTRTAALIGRLVPPMLGSAGPRNYLVVFQNLAEPRSTGGIFGSFAVLNVTDGKIRITDKGSGSRDIGRFSPPLQAPPELSRALYGSLPGEYSTDVNLSPNFPVAAKLISTMYTERRHLPLDGVLGLDPVALSYLMQGAAPIDIGHGLTLTSSNITQTLLSKAYFLYPESAQSPQRDRFLAAALEQAFSSVMTSPGNPNTALNGLRKGAVEGRVLLWSAHENEQKELANTHLVGALPTHDGDHPTVGVFRNDATGAKLGYYAGGSASMSARSCDASGRRLLNLTLTLTNSAPATGLPDYVVGLAHAGPYVLRTNVLIFGPSDGDVTSVLVDGQAVPVVWASENNRKVGMVTVDLRPGQTATVTSGITVNTSGSHGHRFTPTIQLTPGVSTWKTTADGFDAC